MENMENMESIALQEFTEKVVDGIKDYLPEGFAKAETTVRTVTKNNNRRYVALTVRHKEQNIAPVVYLDPYFKRYEDGSCIETILADIAGVIKNHEPEKSFDIGQIMDFDKVRDRIIPRLVNQEMNKDMLCERPHTPVADLAVTYHVMLDEFEGNMASVPISFDLLRAWGRDVSEIHALAIRNMHMCTPSIYVPLGAMLEPLLRDNGDEDLVDLSQTDGLMYVLTNRQKLNGAAAVLDPTMAGTLTESFGGDSYLIPSSIHEWIVVSAKATDPKSIAEMVKEVNAAQVADEDVLSDHAYRFTVAEGLVAV